MAALKNARHERFAQEIAKGIGVGESYEAAGFKPNPGNARRLRGDEEIMKRIEALLDRRELIDEAATKKAIEKLAITKERVLAELAMIGFANIADYVDLEGDYPTWNLRDVPREQMAAVAELTTETIFERTNATGAPSEVRKVKLKFWDKKGALVDIGKHFGMFRERVEMSGPDGNPIETREVGARDRIASRLASLAARDRTGGSLS
jgi:phage terminase small subunit